MNATDSATSHFNSTSTRITELFFYLGSNQFILPLDLSGHLIHCLTGYSSLTLLGYSHFEEKARVAKTLEYFVMQHGRPWSHSGCHEYVIFRHWRCVDIQSGIVYASMYNRFSEQNIFLLSYLLFVLSLNFHVIGEMHGHTKVDRLQD